MRLSLKAGIIPSGSLWIDDASSKVYEVLGELGHPQDLYIVGKKRLKLMESRFPRLRRTLSQQVS